MTTTTPLHFVDALEAIVGAHGGSVAIEDEHGSLSYEDLWQHAGAVAAKLEGLGVGRGQIVGVKLPRSREAIIALLGIWRASAVYLPIDPTWPADRIAFVLRDARCTTIIDASTPATARALTTPSPCRHLQDPAYVIYTSGSTGIPKGVVVSHRGLVPVLTAQIRALGLSDRAPTPKRCLLILSTAFDASLSDIGTCLLSGATLVLEPRELARDPSALVETLERKQITHVDLPPSLLPKIDPATLPPTLEQIIVGGEICPAANLRAWAQHVRVLVAYGPTEATICTSMMSVDPKTWSQPLIGTPLPNVTYEVAEGGELLIAGDHLAIGYHARPDLDEDRFVLRNDVRWYRTGDRVVIHSATEIEFVGRIDRQIKVRGVLVAPEEIEACLAAHPNVRRAAVVHRSLSSGEPSEARGLVAFVETDGRDDEVTSLRRHVRRLLPRALWPQRFERLSRLPETSSGKIDLELLTTHCALSPRKHDPPRGATEVILAACFAEVLLRQRSSSSTNPLEIYRDDDFFVLGGDSFAALELIVAAESRGLIIPGNAIYEAPTLEALASSLRQPVASNGMSASALRIEARGATATAVTVATRRADARRDLFITGATGFFGARVLANLIDRGEERTIHCLVRAANEDEGRRRLAKLVDSDKLANVRVVCGDITAPRFGLSLDQWRTLSDSTSDVFHLAAAVDMVRSFDALRAANLDGTAEVIRFVLDDTGRKRVHYASTLSVLVASDRHEGLLREDDDLRDTRIVFGGYAQTKWAAEVAVRAACGDTATIHRLGLLTSDAHEFAAPKGCQLTLFLRGLLEIGCLPDSDDLDAWALDVTPVDYAARAFVALSSRDNAKKRKTFHVANPKSLMLTQIADAIERRPFAQPLERVSPDEIVRRAATAPLSPAKAAVLLSLGRRIDPEGLRHHRATDLFLATKVDFDTARTRRELEHMGIVCPPPSEILDAHLDHLLATRS